ncbi:MAG: MFS transporter [Bacillota bacterium]|nr:MFS transporter [Bacillota bacterium]
MKLDQKWKTFIIISLGIFMTTLDGSILNIANPSIAADFNVSMDAVKWVVTAYMLMITASLIFFGRLGDKIGSEKIYRTGFIIFTVGSLFCSLSTSLLLLILARIFQGLGGSMMMATGMGIISNTFPASERGKALGLTGAIVGIGNMTGPSLGGLILARYQWPVIFLINLPIGLIAFYLAFRNLEPQPQNPEIREYDLPGTFLFAISVIALVASLSGAQGVNVPILLASLITILLFVQYEGRAAHPMLDFSLFKVKPFLSGNLIAMGIYTIQMSVFFLMPFYMETLLQLPTSTTGLLMTILPITMAITAPLAGTLSDKIGSSRIISASILLISIAFVILSRLGTDTNLINIAIGLFMIGLAMGLFGSPNNSSILGSIPRHKVGYAGGFLSTVRNLAFSLGISVSAAIFTYVYQTAGRTMPFEQAYIQGIHTVYTLAAIIGVFFFLFSLINRRNSKKPPIKQESL